MFQEFVGLVCGHKDLAVDRIGEISEGKFDYGLFVADIPAVICQDLSAYDDLSDLSNDIGDRDRVFGNLLPEDDIGM